MKASFLDLGPQHRALRAEALSCFAGLGQASGSLPAAGRAAGACLSLPIIPEPSDEQVQGVIEAVDAFQKDPRP